jgi:hypothetical protein
MNRNKDKNYKILSINAEKAFDKIQHSFMIRTLNKLRIEGKFLNTIEVIYEKPRVIIILTGKQL